MVTPRTAEISGVLDPPALKGSTLRRQQE